MNDLEKLRVMLPHWIDHNQSHEGEFARWAEKSAAASPETARLLHDAVHSLQKARTSLEAALEQAGGALETPDGAHATQSHEHSHEHGQSHGPDNGHHHHHS